MSKLYVCILLFFVIGSAIAQNAANDIQKINLSINQPDKMDVSLSYKVFSDSTTDDAMQSQEGRWVKSGSLQYHSLGSTETLRKAGDIQVLVDHENKIIVLSNAPERQGDNPALAMAESLTQILATCKSVNYKSIGKDLAAYELHPYLSEFSKITIVFERKSFMPKKMILQQANAVEISDGTVERWVLPRIEIEFKSIVVGRASDDKLNQSKFVLRKGLIYESTAPYKNYQLNNYLLTN